MEKDERTRKDRMKGERKRLEGTSDKESKGRGN